MNALTVELSTVAAIIQGGRHKLSGLHFVNEGDRYPAYGAGGLNGYLATYEFERPAVILSSIGARCGKCFLARDRWSSLANTQVILPDEEKADVRFLWYQLNDESSWPRSGTAQPFIKPSAVKSRLVVLPAIAEQRRLANILDAADAIRRKRQEAVALTDQLLRSTFLEIFGDPVTNPKQWPTTDLGKLTIEGPTNGLYRPASDYGSGTPIIRIDSFHDGTVKNLAKLKRVRIPDDIAARFKLDPGQILINRVNSPEHLGKSALVPDLAETTVFESNMMRLTLDQSRIFPDFLISQMQTNHVKRQIETCRKDASNQSSINQEDVKSFQIRLPPLDLQQRYRAVLAEIRSHRSRLQDTLRQADILFSSLLQRAFTGQL